MPARRTVLRTTAWGTPAVLAAHSLPAFAGSGVNSGVMEFSAGSVTDETRTSFVVSSVTSGGDTVALTVSAVYESDMAAGGDHRHRTNENFAVVAIVPEGEEADVSTLLVQQHWLGQSTSTYGQSTYTFTFAKSVVDVRFDVSGLGLGGGRFGQDMVGFTPRPTAVTLAVNGDLFASPSGNVNAQPGSHDPASPRGRFGVHFAGPVRSIALSFWSAMASSGFPSYDVTQELSVHPISYRLA